MHHRRRPRVATSTNVNEGDEVRGLVDSIRDMLRGVLDRIQYPRSIKNKDVLDVGVVEFKGAKGPLDAYTWLDKMEKAFESTKLPEEKKEKMTVTFLDDLAHHWWTLASRNNGGAQNMTWEQFIKLFLGQYFGHAHCIKIQSDFLNMKKRDNEGVIEFEQKFTTLSYHVSYLVPNERTRIDMFIEALSGVYADKMTSVIYLTFLDVVSAVMTIETSGTYSARP
ncbi:hypothetical protein ACLB2K_041570 [Fragaria x ananassa]